MTFEIIKGDLFDPDHNFDALAQGVNTYGIMGAGIAVPFREKWPAMYESYKALCTKYGATLGGLMHIWAEEWSSEEIIDEKGYPALSIDTGITIYNLFSQITPGKDGSYDLLQKSSILMCQDAENSMLDRVGLPWIGCGLAGLEKHNAQHIFERTFRDSDVEFVLVEQ